MQTIAIREEDKSILERRVPLVPQDLAPLLARGVRVLVEPSSHRVLKDEEFAGIGAELTRDLSPAGVIFGLKEIPSAKIQPGKVHIYFSHTIKGQPYNMAMLRQILRTGATLIDYERVVDDQNRRLIFFGNFAGYAGAINSLYLLGERLAQAGVRTPLQEIRRAMDCDSLAHAHSLVHQAGLELRRQGLPEALCPFVIGVTGYGNVSKGAQDVVNELDPVPITPADLLRGHFERGPNEIYKVVFTEADMVAPVAGGPPFELQHYFQHPEGYRSVFEGYLPRLTVLLNCIYWDARYPRLVTREAVRRLWAQGEKTLRVIGDISCDIEGSIEFTFEAHGPDRPFLVYHPLREEYHLGLEGEGIAVLIEDILPSELPLEASQYFSKVLCPFVPGIAAADFGVPFENLAVPDPIRRAVIVYQGQLTPGYRYLEQYLKD